MLTLLIVLLVLAALGGGWGHTRNWGYARSWSPLGLVLVIILVLWLLGYIGGPAHHLR